MPFSGRAKFQKTNQKVTGKLYEYKEISLPARPKIISPMNIFNNFCQKRVSSSISKGSLTLEAACVLPLFIFAIVCVMQFTQVIQLQTKIGLAIHQESKELAKYAYVYNKIQEGEAGLVGQVAANGLSAIYVKEKVVDQVGENYLEHSIVKGGSGGLSFYQSKFMEEDNMIDIVVTYQIKFRCNIFHLPDYQVVQRGRTRAWTGYENQDGENAGQTEQQILVYVTTNGEVYHTSDKCTHINLSVSMVNQSDIKELRNQGGGKYYPCENCIGNKNVLGNAYITNTGDRYHASSGCSSLKRDVMTIPISEIGARRPCSRCGN